MQTTHFGGFMKRDHVNQSSYVRGLGALGLPVLSLNFWPLIGEISELRFTTARAVSQRYGAMPNRANLAGAFDCAARARVNEKAGHRSSIREAAAQGQLQRQVSSGHAATSTTNLSAITLDRLSPVIELDACRHPRAGPKGAMSWITDRGSAWFHKLTREPRPKRLS